MVFNFKTSLTIISRNDILNCIFFLNGYMAKREKQNLAGKIYIIGHIVCVLPVALTRVEPFCQGSVPLIKGKEGWKGLTRENSKGNGLALGA